MTLHSSIKAIGTVAAQVVQAIAIVELPHNQWPELIGLLLGFVNQDNINLRVATLQAIGFICESIVRRSLFQLFLCDYKFNLSPQKPDVLQARSNEILTAVIHGARKEEASSEVQLAAVHALYSSLEFVNDNFEREVRHPF